MRKKFSLRKLLIDNKEILIGLVFGLILSSTAVYGVIKYSSSNVFYRNVDSNLSATTVQAAIDELFTDCTTRAYTLTVDSRDGTIPETAGWTVTGSTATKPVLFNGTYGTLPTPTKTGYTFDGWFTKVSGGTQVTSSTKYRYDEDSTIYAHWSSNSYTIGYTLNGGSYGSSHPTSGTFGTVLTINKPTKTVTVTGDANGTGATVGTATSKAQTFAGWTYTNGTTSTAMYGSSSSNVSTVWSSGSTKVTAEYFKNLRSSSGTITLTANWTPVAFNLPTVSKEGYTCKWNTKSDGTGTDYNSGASYTPEANGNQNITMYAKCTGNTYTGTFYYQSNTTSGSTTVSNKEVSCTVSSGSNCSVTIPSEVRSSGGTYNNAYAGLSASTGNMTEAVSSSSTTVTLSSNKSYYSLYRTTINIYYPTSTSATTSKAVYQNQWLSSTSAMATTVLSTSTTGTSTNASEGALVSGYSLIGFNASASQNSATWSSIDALTKSDSNKTATRSVYQIEKKTETKTATFYYNNNTTCAGTTVASTTATGTQTTYLRPTSTTAAGTSVSNGSITVPSAVTGSKGPYNGSYVNVASAVNSMSAATVNTGTLTYYAFYRSNVTRYYPSSTTATTSDTLYRNEVFTSTSAMKTVLATTNTGTSTNAAAKLAVSGYSTLVGFNTSASQNTQNSGATIEALTTTCNTTVYEIDKKTETKTATFYYNNNTTCAGTTVASTTATGTQTTYLRPTSTSAAGTSVSNGSITVPSAVTGSKGPYNGTYVNVASAVNSMSAATVNTGTLTYYAFYRSNVTRYYPSSTTATTSDTLYRNEVFTSTSAMKTVLATTNTGTSTNAAAKLAVSGYSTLVGFNTSASQNTQNSGATIEALTTTCNTTVYEIDKRTETVSAVFYYPNDSTGTVDSSVVSGTKTTYLRPTSTSAAGTSVSHGSITPPTTVEPYDTELVGWATDANEMTSVTVNTANEYYFAIYRSEVTNYYWDSDKYSSRTLYKNSFMPINPEEIGGYDYINDPYMVVLSNSSTGTSDFTTATGPGGSTWYYLTDEAGSSEFNTIHAAALSNVTKLFTVYKMNVSYSKGVNVSSIGANSDSCEITSSIAINTTVPNSCTVKLPSITPNSGYTSVGWNTTSGATTGTAAGANYTITSNNTTLYANAYPAITYNAGETCTGATGMPGSQIKLPSTNVTLQSGEPTCTGKAFLGWSTTSNATASSTWYDGGTTYSTDEPLTLYAQFYDVNALENWYTTVAQTSDFTLKSASGKAKLGDTTLYNSATVTPTCSTGWTKRISLSSFEGAMGYYRPYRANTYSTIGVRYLGTECTGGTCVQMDDSNHTFYATSTCTYNRSATTYSDDVNTRIQRLQRIEDVAVKYSEIKAKSNSKENLSFGSSESRSGVTVTADSGYRLISGIAGSNISNGTTNGAGVSRTFLQSALNATTEAVTTIGKSYDSSRPIVNHSFYIIEAMFNKEATRIFDPTSGKGLARYNALVALNNNKNNYFPASYLKEKVVHNKTASIDAWACNKSQTPISIPNGKLLGTSSFGVANDTDGKNGSFAVINKIYVSGANTTSGYLRSYYYAGNKYSNNSTGYALTKNYAYAYVVYLSSGTLTAGTPAAIS